MTLSRKLLGFLCILTVLLGLALPAAASGGSDAPAAGGAPKQVNMRFSWWGGDTRHKATLAAIEAYQKKNPHVKIEAEYGGFDSYYQKLVTQLAGGGAADIIQIDYKWVHDLGAQGKLFVDMNSLKKDIDMSGFDMDFAKSYGAHGDYLLGLPTGLNAMALLANTDLLEKAGIKFKENWTWEEVLEVGAKMHSANKSWYLIGSQPQQLLYMLKTQMKQKTGSDIIKDDLTLGFAKKDLVDTFEYIRKALEVGALAPLEEVVLYDGKGWDQIPNWLNGNYGMATAWASTVTTVKNVSKFKVDIARFPLPAKKPKNGGLLTTPSQLLSVNAKSPNAKEAIKFVNWFFNDEEAAIILSDSRGVPPTVNARKVLAAANKLDPNVTKGIELTLPYSGGAENGPTLAKEVETVVKDYIQKVGYKALTPDAAATELMKELEKIAASMKK